MKPKDFASLDAAIEKWMDNLLEDYGAYWPPNLPERMAEAARCVFDAWVESQVVYKRENE